MAATATGRDGGIRGRIVSINGPIVRATGMDEAGMLDLVHVGARELYGEIIRLDRGLATIQVYEDNTMMEVGEAVVSFRRPLSVRLGPGLLGGIFDGLQRPLEALTGVSGTYLTPGVKAPPLPEQRRWRFVPGARPGEAVGPGARLGHVQETELVRHHVLVPPGTRASTVASIVAEGDYTIEDPVAVLADGTELRLAHWWPARRPRPTRARLPTREPLITGQRVIDMFFPIAKGGVAAIPGGFGTGKTMTQHALAKWAAADLIVYIGCGERGNEMTEVLSEFPRLVDPRTGKPLLERTIMIANVSNMPVAAREVSIYTGITVAEYYRDMGYDVAIMADSTSRWAEALRELSGRLEEMPAEEGFPAYLPTRLAEFYERAGLVETLGGGPGSISIIGAISPPGGDFSEPVTQHTKRFIRCFWALDRVLANARHYPAISWLDSYSEYVEETDAFWATQDPEVVELRGRALALLKEDDRLAQIVKLIGPDSLPEPDRLILLVASQIKKGFLQQNSYDEVDMFAMPAKQIALLKVFMALYDGGRAALAAGVPLARIGALPVLDELSRLKSRLTNEETAKVDAVTERVRRACAELSEAEAPPAAPVAGGREGP